MSVDVHRLSVAELAAAPALLTPEGWSLELAELTRLHDLGGAVGAYEDGEMVGFLTYIDTPPYRWVGNVVVDPRVRGKGIGARLVEEAFRDSPHAALYSVEHAIPLYARFGLDVSGELLSLRADPGRPLSTGHSRPMEVAKDMPAVLALDRAVVGMDRERLLRSLAAVHPARVREEDGVIVGFGIAKAYPDVTEIGPVIAQTRAFAWDIIDDLIAATAAPHDIAAWTLTPEAKERGFEQLFIATPMFRGGDPAWDLARYHAVAGLEKG